jgi:hypothetical protein
VWRCAYETRNAAARQQPRLELVPSIDALVPRATTASWVAGRESARRFLQALCAHAFVPVGDALVPEAAQGSGDRAAPV